MGRTKGALNKKTLAENGMDFDNTVIEGENVSRETPRKKPSATSVQKETIADKLNIACDGIFSLLGYQYQYTAEDFKKESIALASLSKDYSVIAKIIEFFDPLLIVCGLWQKFKGLKKKEKQPKQKQQEKQTDEKTINMTPVPNEGGNNVFQFKVGG